MTWPIVRLGDVCDIRIGRTPSRSERAYWGAGHAWLSIADMNQGRALIATREQITERAVREVMGQPVQSGTVMFSFKLSIGKVGIAAAPMYSNEAIAALPIKVPSQLSAPYLYWALKTVDLTMSTDRAAMGETLNTAKLKQIPIPLPPIDEQRRIAEVLDRADALSAKRREALGLLRDLTQSVFLDMFGDPVANTLRWPMQTLGELGDLDRGVSKHRPRNDPLLLGGPYPLVQTGDVARSGGLIVTASGSYSEAGLRQSKLWPTGTLCITIAANIARTGILTFPACFPDSVVGFAADRATTQYIRVWLSFLQKSLEDSAPESAQKNINLALLRGLRVPTPPLSLRLQFDERVRTIWAAEAKAVLHLSTLNSLFLALKHRAFRGEL